MEHKKYLYKTGQNSSYQMLKIFKTSSACILTNYLKSTFAQNLNMIPQFGPYLKK